MSSTMDEALINHLSLPPLLPQRQDHDIDKVEVDLVERLVRATKVMRDLPDNPSLEVWDSIRRSLEACKSITVNRRLEKASLITALRNISRTDFLPVYIGTQNAALFIYHSL